MSDPCAGDYGTTFTFTILENGQPVNISAATTKIAILVRPGGSFIAPAAVFVTNGTDGQLQYTTVAGDLDPTITGLYTFQVMVILPSGKWYSTAYSFNVRPRIALGAP